MNTDLLRSRFQRQVLLILLATLVVGRVECFAKETWFDQRVVWKFGKEGSAWKTAIKNPHGHGGYQLILRPLWAVEGGVVALEIVVARPGQPDANLLGERENGGEYPFVITVEELNNGLEQSKFGVVRKVEADEIALNIKIERFRLGRGLGSGSTYCSSCKNLQELSMWITAESKEPQSTKRRQSGYFTTNPILGRRAAGSAFKS